MSKNKFTKIVSTVGTDWRMIHKILITRVNETLGGESPCESVATIIVGTTNHDWLPPTDAVAAAGARC